MTTFHFFDIPQGFRGQNLEYGGSNVKWIGTLHSFWAYKTLQIGIGHWTLEGFEIWILVAFCFFIHVDGNLGIPKGESFWNLKTFVDTYLWSMNRDVGICIGTTHSSVEYHKLDLFWLHFHRTWILLYFSWIFSKQGSTNLSTNFHFQFDVWIKCGL